MDNSRFTITISLTPEEQDKIYKMSEEFVKHKEKQGSNEKYKQGKKSSFDYDRQGFSGELAVHKYFGLDYDYDFDRKWRLDDIRLYYDDILVICDVKTSIDGVLRIPARQIETEYEKDLKVVPSTYIAVKIDEDYTTCEILGIITRKKFRANMILNKRWDTPCYTLPFGKQLNLLTDVDVLCV